MAASLPPLSTYAVRSFPRPVPFRAFQAWCVQVRTFEHHFEVEIILKVTPRTINLATVYLTVETVPGRFLFGLNVGHLSNSPHISS